MAEYTVLDPSGQVTTTRSLTAEEYEGWVDWTEPITGESMGTPRKPDERSKGSPLFAEMTSNAPKSLSVAAALHAEVSEALDAAQQDALSEIRRWLGQHSVTRVGPRDAREVLPIERMQVGRKTDGASDRGDQSRGAATRVLRRRMIACLGRIHAPDHHRTCLRSGCFMPEW